jgi:hypothetical protein
MREPFVRYELITDEPAETLLDEYQTAMPSLGWTKRDEGKLKVGDETDQYVGYGKDKDRSKVTVRSKPGGPTRVELNFSPVYFSEAPDLRPGTSP